MKIEDEQLLGRWRAEQRSHLAVALCTSIAQQAEQAPFQIDVARLVSIGREVEQSHLTDPNVLCAVGRLYLAAGGLRHAMKPLVAAATALGTPLTYRLVGELSLRLGDAERSVKTFERAIELGGDSEDLRAWLETARGYIPVQLELGRDVVARSVELALRSAAGAVALAEGEDVQGERTVMRAVAPDGSLLDANGSDGGAFAGRGSIVDYDLDAEGLGRGELFSGPDDSTDDGGRTHVISRAKADAPSAVVAAIEAAARQLPPAPRGRMHTEPLDGRPVLNPAGGERSVAGAELPAPRPADVAHASAMPPRAAVVTSAAASKPQAAPGGRKPLVLWKGGLLGLLVLAVVGGGLTYARHRGLITWPRRTPTAAVESPPAQAPPPEFDTQPVPAETAASPEATSPTEATSAAPTAVPDTAASQAEPSATPPESTASASAPPTIAPPRSATPTSTAALPVPPRKPAPTAKPRPPKPPDRPADAAPATPLWDGDPELGGRGN